MPLDKYDLANFILCVIKVQELPTNVQLSEIPKCIHKISEIYV